jgi:2-polyprenyl-3-methyl-5-hydroxy-6-metoxy-1,4-benzoquinol methylase
MNDSGLHRSQPAGEREKKFFYERFAARFDAEMDMYDCSRRIEIVFDEFLGDVCLEGRRFLDAGCGTGHFSRRAHERGAIVFSVDLGPGLLGEVRKKCAAHLAAGDVLALPFPDGAFDYVLSTEVIEHTVNPGMAVAELMRVLRPGGTVVLTAPNRLWHFAVSIAETLRLRPYQGYENWPGWREMRRYLAACGGDIRDMKGFHLFPFVLKCSHGLLRRLDRGGRLLGPFMVNMAVKALKTDDASPPLVVK